MKLDDWIYKRFIAHDSFFRPSRRKLKNVEFYIILERHWIHKPINQSEIEFAPLDINKS